MDQSKQAQLVELLKELESGYLPYKIFLEVARLATLPIVEFVPLRTTKTGQVEILLLKRDEDDLVWSGQLHTPGTVIRPTDTQERMMDVFERITKDELKDTELSNANLFATRLRRSERGNELARVYWLEVLGEPQAGRFYDVEELPDNIIESQVEYIQEAVKLFREFKAM